MPIGMVTGQHLVDAFWLIDPCPIPSERTLPGRIGITQPFVLSCLLADCSNTISNVRSPVPHTG